MEVFSDHPNESDTTDSGLSGEVVLHASVEDADGALFSPGTELDGSPFQKADPLVC